MSWLHHVTLLVYNLRDGLGGSITPATEKKDFHTHSTPAYQFSPPSFSEKKTNHVLHSQNEAYLTSLP